MQKTALVLWLALLTWGCSGEDDPGKTPPVGNTELVSAPIRPSGPSIVAAGSQHSYVSGGAINSEGHTVEYRFDFDADGGHDYTSWTRNTIAQKSWMSTGLRTVAVQARCEIHTSVESEWSLDKVVEIGDGPTTEVTSVINTYFVGNDKFTETLNLADGVPDTVPYGSWVKLFYEGTPSPQGDSLCADDVNECLRYQANYTWVSVRVPGVENTIAWRPFDPEDSNAAGVMDSTTLNIGSVEYTIRARSVDQFDRADVSPPEVDVVGNFPPTLDSWSIKDGNGNLVADGDTVAWDWWNPSNTPDTIAVYPDSINVVKKFIFVLEATGHDHPKETTGVRGWKYTFQRVGSNPPLYERFARAGDFVDGVTVDMLSDTARVTFRYNPMTDPGGADLLANRYPDFLDKMYEYAVIGRDSSEGDHFRQYMHYGGTRNLVNDYNTALYGRWTDQGTWRFFLTLNR